MMIELTKKHVEEMFTISNGYEHDAQVSQSVSVSHCTVIIALRCLHMASDLLSSVYSFHQYFCLICR